MSVDLKHKNIGRTNCALSYKLVATVLAVGLFAYALISNATGAQPENTEYANRADAVPVPPRSTFTSPDDLDAYDRFVARYACQWGYYKNVGKDRIPDTDPKVGGLYRSLIHSPILAMHMKELAYFYRSRGETKGSFTHADRVWVDVVMGKKFGDQMAGAAMDGVAVGLRPEAVLAILENHEQDLTPEEARMTQIIRNFTDRKLVPADWQYLEKRFGSFRGAVEYIAWLGHFQAVVHWMAAYTTYAPESFATRPSGADLDAKAAAMVRAAMKDKKKLPGPKSGVLNFEYTPGKC